MFYIDDIRKWANHVISGKIVGGGAEADDSIKATAKRVLDALTPLCPLEENMLNASDIDPGIFPSDKNLRAIQPGDTIKVFHFVGVRGKAYYMYKFVSGVTMLPSWTEPKLVISDLSLNKRSYLLDMDGAQIKEIEIVQGYGFDGIPFDSRKPRNEPDAIVRLATA